jgi:hypothetical protein
VLVFYIGLLGAIFLRSFYVYQTNDEPKIPANLKEVQIKTCKLGNQTFVEQNQLQNFEETKNLSNVTIVKEEPSCASLEFMSKCEDEWTIEQVKKFFHLKVFFLTKKIAERASEDHDRR